MLVGHPGVETRLPEQRDRLLETGASDVANCRNLNDVDSCAAVVLPTSGDRAILFPEHIAADRPVEVANLSRPRATSGQLHKERPRVYTPLVRMVPLLEERDVDGPLVGPIDQCTVDQLVEAGESLGLQRQGQREMHRKRT